MTIENIVDIHVPTAKTVPLLDRYQDVGLSKWGRPELALALAERGATVVFSRGKQAYDIDADSAAVLQPDIRRVDDTFEVFVKPAIIALSSIRAIRNITATINNGLPELNHSDIRAASKDKVLTNELLAGVGIHKAFVGWRLGESFEQAIDMMPSDTIVIKPRRGMRSRGVNIGTKAEIMLLQKQGQFDDDEWIVEEKLDLQTPVPLRGLRPEDQEVIEFVNNRNLPKELRVYSFGYSAGSLVTSIVLRASRDGDTHLHNDRWVFVDPESVPQEVLAKTNIVCDTFTAATGVREMHAATDWVLATREHATMPEWLPMKVNTAEPQLVYETDHVEIAHQQAGMLADQLLRVAANASTK